MYGNANILLGGNEVFLLFLADKHAGVGVAVVLDAVVYLGLLGVVEAVERSDKVAGDAADPFELASR